MMETESRRFNSRRRPAVSGGHHCPLPGPCSPGFTLIELLVVIGIIAALIGILIPTVSAVRKSAQAAATSQEISTIRNAIERYYQDFNAYPGPIPNEDATGGPSIRTGAYLNGTTVSATASTNRITAAENLYLGLCGGLRNTAGVIAYDIAVATGQQGPFSLNLNKPGKSPAYLTVTPDFTSLNTVGLSTPGQLNPNGVTGDTAIPEFVDRFPDYDLPILYLRASAGKTGVVSNATTPGSGVTYQYDLRDVTPYTSKTSVTHLGSSPNAHGLLAIGTSSAAPIAPNITYDGWPYLISPASSDTTNTGGTPRQKDGYLLISAGKDRIFGTADDITSFGGLTGD